MYVDKNLPRLRKASGLSQEALARKLGVSEKTVRRWEAGESQPRYDEVQGLKTVLELKSDAELGEPDAGDGPRVERSQDTVHAAAFRIATKYDMDAVQMQQLAFEADDLAGLSGDIDAALERKAKRIMDGAPRERPPAVHEKTAQYAKAAATDEAKAQAENDGLMQRQPRGATTRVVNPRKPGKGPRRR